jgi:hypothetical protein
MARAASLPVTWLVRHMQCLHIDQRLDRLCFRIPKDAGSTFKQLILPLTYLVGMHIKLLSQFRQRLLAPDSGKRYFGLEGRAVVPAGSLRHRLSCSRQSCRVQAKNPLNIGVQISRATSWSWSQWPHANA